jgi:single-strand DNA-binding protein
MAGSLNKVMLIGNLGADPEVRSFQNGGRVCNLRIATSENWKDRDGQRQERTEWHSVAIFSDGLINVCENYLRKGSKVFIEGQLRGFNGTLTMLDGRGEGGGGGMRGGGQSGGHSGGQGGGSDDWGGGGGSSGGSGAGGGYADDLDDDIPF